MKTNVQVLRNQEYAPRKYHRQISQSITKSPSAWYYSTSIALYESCKWQGRRLDAMKFAPAKQFHWIWLPNRPPASVFHQIFENPTFHARCKPRISGFPCRSHAPFHGSIAPPKHIRLTKNTASENERAGFEKIEIMHLENIIARSINRWQNHPRRGITLQA